MRDLKIYISVATLLLVVYLVAQYNRPREVSWAESLINTDKIPFGTYITYQRLHDIFPQAKITSAKEPVYNILDEQGNNDGVYIIVASTVKITKTDYGLLNAYIAKGNEVFISANYFGEDLQKKLKFDVESELKSGAVSLRFLNPNVDTGQYYSLNREVSNVYFSKIDTNRTYGLGQNSLHHLNFIKFKIGKGTLYLNTMPLMFSNYSLLSVQGADYASMALSHIRNNRNLIWDEYYTQGRDDDESLFRVFLRSTALRWAFYLASISLLIFVLYEAKRRQRIIPIVEPLQNSTLDFVNVVGQVYYEQRNNANIAQKTVSYFLEHVRTTYYLKTNILDQDFITALSLKSGVNNELVQQLISQFTLVRSGYSVTDKELITLNQNIEQFYSQAG